VEREGFQRYSERIHLRAGQQRRMKVLLQPLSAEGDR
jgi:hypothetical protein